MDQESKELLPAPSQALGTATPTARKPLVNDLMAYLPSSSQPGSPTSSVVAKTPPRSSPRTTLQKQGRSYTIGGGITPSLRKIDNLRLPPGLRDKGRPSPPSPIRRPDPCIDQRHFLQPSSSFNTLEELEQRAHFLRHSIDYTDLPDAAPFITQRFASPVAPLPRVNTTSSILSIPPTRNESMYLTDIQQLNRSLSFRSTIERPSSRASITSNPRELSESRPGSPSIRRAQRPGSLYVDFSNWLAADQLQSNPLGIRGGAGLNAPSGSPSRGPPQTARPTLKRSKEEPQTLSPLLTLQPLSPEVRPPLNSLPPRVPSGKLPVPARTTRTPSDVTIRGLHTNERALAGDSPPGTSRRRGSSHAAPTIASQLKTKEKVSPPSSDMSSPPSSDSILPRNLAHELVGLSPRTRTRSPSWNPSSDYVEGLKLQKAQSQNSLSPQSQHSLATHRSASPAP
ncbi:hypothetical protein FRB90_005482, partial [Tulasnella sp. 427]